MWVCVHTATPPNLRLSTLTPIEPLICTEVLEQIPDLCTVLHEITQRLTRLALVDFDTPAAAVLALPNELWVNSPALAEQGVEVNLAQAVDGGYSLPRAWMIR